MLIYCGYRACFNQTIRGDMSCLKNVMNLLHNTLNCFAINTQNICTHQNLWIFVDKIMYLWINCGSFIIIFGLYFSNLSHNNQ